MQVGRSSTQFEIVSFVISRDHHRSVSLTFIISKFENSSHLALI